MFWMFTIDWTVIIPNLFHFARCFTVLVHLPYSHIKGIKTRMNATRYNLKEIPGLLIEFLLILLNSILVFDWNWVPFVHSSYCAFHPTQANYFYHFVWIWFSVPEILLWNQNGWFWHWTLSWRILTCKLILCWRSQTSFAFWIWLVWLAV